MKNFSKITRVFAIILIIVICVNKVFSQNSGSFLEFKLRVEYEKEALGNANVDVFHNGKKIKSSKTDIKGMVEFRFDFNKTFILEISKKDLVSQKIEIDTELPTDVMGEFTYPFRISMFDKAVGLNTSLLAKQSIARVKYLADMEDFDIDETYTTGMSEKVKKIKKQLATIKKVSYDKEIKKADKYMEEKNYEMAEKSYWKASDLLTNERYPRLQITKIKKLRKSDKKDVENYKNAIETADGYFNAKKYGKAKKSYQKAMAYMPSETYPQDKIKKINSFFSLDEKEKNKQLEKEKEYKREINKGNSFLRTKNFEDARNSFHTALRIKPESKYAKKKLKQISEFLDNKKNKNESKEEKEKRYKKELSKADIFFGEKKYEKAKKFYEEALKIKPSSIYPKSKIIEIEKLNKSKATIDKEYQNSFMTAEKYEKAGNYELAKRNYKKALDVKPSETHLNAKIQTMTEFIKKQNDRKNSLDYKRAIDNGDLFFEKKDYRKARSFYLDAKKINPNNATNINKKIRELDKLIKQNENKDETARKKKMKYNIKMKYGDKMLKEENYKYAKKSYKQASEIFPDEKLPKEKIREINKILRKVILEKEQEKLSKENYEKYLHMADSAFRAEDYVKAKNFYESAMSISSDKNSIKIRIDEVKDIIVGKARKEMIMEKREQDYKAKMNLGYELFANSMYEEAKKVYQKALEVIPTSQDAIDRIDELEPLIQKKIAEREEERRMSEEYNEELETANSFFNEGNYLEAKFSYERAVKINSTSFANERIIEINNLLVAEENKTKQMEFYDTEVKRAENSIRKKEYKDAKIYYQKALLLLKDNKIAKDKIAELDILIKKQKLEEKKIKEQEEKYNAFFTRANSLLLANVYDEAKKHYEMALKIKPKEKVPKEKLGIIKRILLKEKKEKEERAKKDASYKNFIAIADGLFNENSLNEAKSNYIRASKIKKYAAYPKVQLKKIKEIKDALKKKDRDAWEKAQRKKMLDARAKRIELEKRELDEAARAIEEAKRYSDLVKNYPEGITIEKIVNDKKTVTIVIVHRDGLAYEYKKVVHAWGGDPVCFKNGMNISITVFENSIKPAEGEEVFKMK